MMPELITELISENNILIHLGDDINEETLVVIQQAKLCAERHFGEAFLDSISSYTSLLIKFDPLLLSPYHAEDIFSQAWQQEQQGKNSALTEHIQQAASTIIEVPVCYEPEVALDIELIAKHLNLHHKDVARMHYEQTYRVYAMGFSPGFAYMGILPAALKTDRRAEPRTSVPAGSVAISDRQTAIYPQSSPGGWHIIGRTPMDVFDPNKEPANLFSVTDTIKFYPIGLSEYTRLTTSQKSLATTPQNNA